MSGMRHLRPALTVLAGVLIYLGAGVWGSSPARPYLILAGVLVLIVALVWCFLNFQRDANSGEFTSGWLIAAAPQALLIAATLLHVAGRRIPQDVEGIDWAALFSGGWAVFASIGAVLFLFVEMALWNPAPAQLQASRVRRAADAGTVMGLLLVLVATLVFLFDGLAWQWDVSYFKTSQPSQATRELVEGLPESVDVAAFFPANNPVGHHVVNYLNNLNGDSSASAQLDVQFYDAELAPARADEFKVRSNGRVVLRKGSVLKTITLGETMAKARRKLRKFDGDFNKELLALSQERRKFYLTVGHGERNEKAEGGRPREVATTRFTQLARSANFEIKPLGFADGLGSTIPADAAVVGILGPTLPFRTAEVDALREYLRGGGRVLLFLEPAIAGGQREEPEAGVGPLLKEWGLSYVSAPLANDRIFARRSYSDADHGLLVTNGYLNHPVVSALRARANQNPLLLLSSGMLKKQKPPKGISVIKLLNAMPGTWSDHNGDFKFDPKSEQRSVPLIGAVVTGLAPKSGRTGRKKPAVKGAPLGSKSTNDAALKNPGTVIAYADADLTSDLLLRNRANAGLMLSSISWLAGENRPISQPASEEDVRLLHANRNELAWFYVPIFVVPLLVLVFGGAMALRRGKRRGRPAND